ncbi:MAG TPA: hypothetical protein VGM05_12245 [Planctomycetaceae bacterium]|jgi:hypothetical protein
MHRLFTAHLTHNPLFRSPLTLGAVLVMLTSATPGFGQSAGAKLGQKSGPVRVQPVSQAVSQTAGEPAVQVGAPATGHSIGHRHCCNRPEVFLLRGGAGYWPRVASFEETLRSSGLEPKTIYHWQHRGLADEIASAYQAGELAGPITIIGYSSGADAACWMSERLNKAGVPVTTLILIESTFGISVPSNVSYCFNIYESRGWTDKIPAFRGIPVEAKNPNTQLFNTNVTYHPELAGLQERNHFTMAVTRQMHTMLTNIIIERNQQLQAAVPEAGPQMPAESEGSGAGEGPAQEARLPNSESVLK